MTADRLRVSLDNRYQARSQPVTAHVLLPYLHRASRQGWEDIYPGRRSADLK